MRCAWKELLDVLPQWMRAEVDRQGRQNMEELRLRLNQPPELVFAQECHYLKQDITAADLSFVVNAASRYSPWTAESAAQGYLTAPGGHRIGLCGEAIVHDGKITGIRNLRSLCIRIARDYPELGQGINLKNKSSLILGAPGWGKTTLLRSLLRQLAEQETVAVVDERKELFPQGFSAGKRMDILTGCRKADGIEMLLRTMGPSYIGMDEITAKEDCEALLHAANCGVNLIAAAHASSIEDFRNRTAYHILQESHLFKQIILLHADKTWSLIGGIL